MKSLRMKITRMTVCVVIAAVLSVTLLTVLFVQNNERHKSDQLLYLLCETGEQNLNFYFNSVQKSVGKVSAFAEEDLEGLDDESLRRHMEHVSEFFEQTAYRTSGVLTYYYRVDPEISQTVKGFWYTNLDGNGFKEHEVTDITQYDTDDTSRLVWFTVPKHEGKAIWLPPYITDNLDMRVISYNVPIFWRGTFVGVIGIEIDYTTMAEQVDSIRLYNDGYAFLNDAEGNLFYHPRIDVAELTEETMPEMPDGLLSSKTFIQYTFQGVPRQAAWLELSNGMRLNVTVPVSEAKGDWNRLIGNIVLLSAGVVVAAILFTMFYTRRITRPLEQLTEAAEQADRGNYHYQLDYDNDDEIGKLMQSFKKMSGHMQDHLNDLSKRVYVDALTSVKNKGAYSDYIGKLDQRRERGERLAFAVGVFDCNDLKSINDKYGHEKGDAYLKSASRLICRVFQHSPVFRIGGDEFSVILQNDDYNNREALLRQFKEGMENSRTLTPNVWEQVDVSMGFAAYDPANDHAVIDTVRRADKAMYDNKREQKKGRL